VLPSPRVVGSPDLANYAHSIFRPRRDIAGCLAELASQIHADFAYRKSSTTVSSTLSDLFRQRVGVCQDFAHLAVGVLRTAGLAARYVSGYLETFPPPGQAKLMGADATHAWAEAFLPGHGWIGIDPTNNQRADDRYIVAAHGRDYDDVPPLKGVIETESRRSKMTVSVDVRRIE